MTGLFRKEVASRQANRLEGDIRLDIAPGFFVSAGVLGTFIVSALIYLSVATYSRTETVSGFVSPSTGLTVVRATAGGNIASLLVRQGAQVSKGQALVLLGQDRLFADGNDVNKARLSAIEEQVIRTDLAISTEQNRNKSDITSFNNSYMILQSREDASRDRMSILQKRVENQISLVEKYEKLISQQYVSEASLIQQRDVLLSLREDLVIQQISLYDIDEERLKLEHKIIEAPLIQNQNIEMLLRRRDELSEKSWDAQLKSSSQISSPIGGTISALLVIESEYVELGQPLMHVYRDDSDMEALLYVASVSIGTIREKQDVKVRLAAFPHEKFGVVTGRVIEIGKSVVEEKDRPIIEGLSGPAYMVRVQLPHKVVELNGEKFPLRPGMAVRAEILVDQRSILQWISAPFRRLGKTD